MHNRWLPWLWHFSSLTLLGLDETVYFHKDSKLSEMVLRFYEILLWIFIYFPAKSPPPFPRPCVSDWPASLHFTLYKPVGCRTLLYNVHWTLRFFFSAVLYYLHCICHLLIHETLNELYKTIYSMEARLSYKIETW